MENKYYKRNITIAIILGILLFITVIAVTNKYLDENKIEIEPNDIETEESPEGIDDIEYFEDGILLSELIEDGYKLNINGNNVTRITKSEEMYDIYAIDDNNKIVYVSYGEN